MTCMNDPFNVLELTPTAAPAEIRRRYLELVRRHPPEREPKRFAEIRAAYDALADPLESLKRRLFDTKTETPEEILRSLESTQRIPTDLLLSLAR